MSNIRIVLYLVMALFLAACGSSSSSVATEEVVEVTRTVVVEVETVEVETVTASAPDLVIQSFRVVEPDWSSGGFQAAAEVVVKNEGDLPAHDFEVGILSVNREDVHLQFAFVYDPVLTVELAPGQAVALEGDTWLGHHSFFDVGCMEEAYDPDGCAMRDENALWLMAIADYCPDDGLVDDCAVEESDETNNVSETVVVERVSMFEPTSPPLPDAVVRVNALNVRTGPGVVYDRIGGVRQGDELEVVGQAYDCGWLKVVTPGRTEGWVSGKPAYVTLNLDCSDIPAAEIPPAPTPPPTDVPAPKPVVVIMDSAHETVVYHDETFQAEETNAHDVARILADLPIDIRIETTSPEWDRAEAVRAQNPALVIIHSSAFYDPEGSNDMFGSFLDYMRDETSAVFLVYSRFQGYAQEEHHKQRFETIHDLHGRVEILYVRFRWDQDDVPETLEDKVELLLAPTPLVVLMDRIPYMIHTNAEILVDLPVEIVEELTDPDWSEGERIRDLDPDLVVIHWSALYFQGEDTGGDFYEKRLDPFMNEHMQDTRSIFLFYTTSGGIEMMEGELAARYPYLITTTPIRLRVLPGAGGAGWSQALHEKVATILGLP